MDHFPVGVARLASPILTKTFWSHGRTNVARGSLDSEKWLDVQGFTNCTAAHFVAKCHAMNF